MCIISILPKGKKKDTEEVITFITNGFNNNKDGSGFMYKKAGTKSVVISKGYDDLEKLLANIKKANLTEDDELVVHHRIGNVGFKNDINTHPFVCSEDSTDFLELEAKFNKPCLVHNGTFYGITDLKSKNPNNSDTYAFSRYIISNKHLQNLLKTDLELFEYVMDDILNKGKLCFLFPDRDLLKVGNFIEDEGYFHSNEGYKDGWYRDVGGVLKKKHTPPAVMPSKGHGGTSSLDEDLVKNYKMHLSSLLHKLTLTLDGSLIRINSFNADNFIFGYKNSHHPDYCRAFKPVNYDDKANINPFVYTSNFDMKMTIYVNENNLHRDMEFMVKSSLIDSYREYIMLQRDLDVSKKTMKTLYNQLRNSRFRTLDFKLYNKKTNCYYTRLALIEYYNYYKEDLMKDPTELDIKSIVHPIETILIKDYTKEDLPVLQGAD